MNHYLDQFSTREVRDLAWVIASPPLVSGEINNTHWWTRDDCLNEFADCLSTLKKLDKNPRNLIENLEQLKSKRLGSVFEGLVSYWLKISPNYDVISQNIQIIDAGVTYGEIDFIIRDHKAKKNIHLEVAVKFYLGSPPYEDPFRWFGTNTKDQLGKKITHLEKHQTQLSLKHPSHFNLDIDEKHCFIKGRLFSPENINTAPNSMNVNANHLRGNWSYLKDYRNDEHIISIEKEHWLAEFNEEDIIKILENQNNRTNLEYLDRAQCYVVVEKNKNSYVETHRKFYLPNSFIFPKAIRL